MSLVLPVFYHWSPTANRKRINHRGLLPTCGTCAGIGPPDRDGYRWVDRDNTFKAICLGTSPSHAWSLSGAIFAERGATWDLWQVCLDDNDEVHPLPFFGNRLEEVRVANRIPKRRVWLVGERTAA